MIVGNDVFISKSAEITRPELCQVGCHVAIDSFFYCTTKLTLGDYIHISSHVAVIGGSAAELQVEDFCFLSVGSKYICGSETFHGGGLVGPLIPDQYKDEQHIAPIILKRFSGALTNSVIMPGVIMAEGSILGANSMLKASTEPWTVYVGNPAKPIRLRNREKAYEYAANLGYRYD